MCRRWWTASAPASWTPLPPTTRPTPKRTSSRAWPVWWAARRPFGVCYTKLCKQEGLPLEVLVHLMSTRPAEILGLAKGQLEPGYDADFVLVDLDTPYTVDKDKLHSKSSQHPLRRRGAVTARCAPPSRAASSPIRPRSNAHGQQARPLSLTSFGSSPKGRALVHKSAGKAVPLLRRMTSLRQQGKMLHSDNGGAGNARNGVDWEGRYAIYK